MSDLDTFPDLECHTLDKCEYSAAWNATSIVVSFNGANATLAAADLIRRWLKWAKPQINWTEFGFRQLDATGHATAEPMFWRITDEDGIVGDRWYVSMVAMWILGLTGGTYTVFARRESIDGL